MLTFSELSNKYLAWCKAHQSLRTYEWYSNYINTFNAWTGIADIEAMALKPYQVQEWIDSHGEDWGDNYRGGAVVAIKRVFNWGEEQGYVDNNPIRKMKKPSPKRREIYMKPEDKEAIIYHLDNNDPFMDFFIFVWETGSRPQEARNIEKRHVDLENERIVFPKDESKGKRVSRVIYMQGEALEIIKRLAEKYSEGKLFRNKRGEAWSKYAVCNRFSRLSEKIGKRLFAYSCRHGWATRKLIQGHDHLTVAAQLGHADGSMLAKVYSHVADNGAHIKKLLID